MTREREKTKVLTNGMNARNYRTGSHKNVKDHMVQGRQRIERLHLRALQYRLSDSLTPPTLV